MDKIRILFIIASSKIGGAENFIYSLLGSLDDSRYEKYIVCPAGGYYSKKFEASAKESLFIDPKRSFMNIGTILKVVRFIKKNRIDLVHTMLYTSDFCGIISGLTSTRPRIVNTINGFNFLVTQTGRLRLKRRMASILYRYIYRFSDKLVAVAEAVRKDLIERRGFRVSGNKIETVLAAGTDNTYEVSEDSVADLRGRYGLDGNVVLSAVGSLEEVKDYDTMLSAFSAVKNKNANIKLLIAGEGPERNRLEKKKSEAGLDGSVFFLGPLERKKINALLSLTDIFITSSKSEGCPTVLLEAMFFGKAAVATRAGGIPEVLKDDKTGILVKISDRKTMADAVLNLAGDKEKREKFGAAARQSFLQSFTNKHMIQSYEDIYNKILSGN